MTALQKSFLMQCLTGLTGAIAIVGITIGLVELVKCEHVENIGRGFIFLVIGMLSFVLAFQFFKRSHTFYWEAVERNRQEIRAERERCSICGGINCQRQHTFGGGGRGYYMGIDYADGVVPNRNGNIYGESITRHIRDLQLQAAALQMPIMTAQQRTDGIEPLYSMSFTVLKNRETKQDNDKKEVVEEPIRRTVLNAISDLEIDD